MTPWLQDPDVTLYHGDNLDVLRQLPDRSVHMCATSPPFFGLRDYGTGLWEGGDPDCDHVPGYANDAASRDKHTQPQADHESGFRNSTRYVTQRGHNTTDCRCGARRVDQQIGLEDTPDLWVERLVAVFREVRRVLRDDGTLWVEIGDSYTSAASGGAGAPAKQHTNAGSLIGRGSVPNGHKPKDLLGQPWLLAFALRADGWYLRSEIIWARPNPMPESVTDRPTKSHSTVFLLSKQPRYYYDADAIREAYSDNSHGGLRPNNGDKQRALGRTRHGALGIAPGKQPDNHGGANARSVWTIPTQPTPFAHFATWPEALVRRMILAGTSERGCCPECGAPWVRDVEHGESDYARLKREQGHEWTDMDAAALERGTITRAGEGGQTRNANGTVPSLKPRAGRTLDWKPTCSCGTGDVSEVLDDDMDAEPLRGSVPVLRTHLAPVPCVVLDPFAGSATTMLVARNHGRHSIGIELNADYLTIAAKRLQQLSLLST